MMEEYAFMDGKSLEERASMKGFTERVA